MKRLEPKVANYIRVKFLLGLIIQVPLIIVYVFIHQHYDLDLWLLYVPIGLILLGYIWSLFIRPGIYMRVTKYDHSKTAFELKYGLIFVRKEMLPLRRIQDVTMQTGVISRRFNLGILSISSASQRIVTPPLDIDELEQLQKDLIEIVKAVDNHA